MCRTACRGLCSGLTGALSRARRFGGSAGVTARARTGGGGSPGARSRSPIGCAWTSRMMIRCGSPMRRSISRLCARPWRAAAGADCLPAHRPGSARPARAGSSREELRDRSGSDQRAAGRGGRSGGAWALGGGPHHRARQLSDRHARGALKPLHDAAAPPADERPGPRVKNGPAVAGHGAEAVRDAIAEAITTLPVQLRRSLTWGQGTEITPRAVADPDRPAGLLLRSTQPVAARHQPEHQRAAAPVLPKGTDLSRHSADDLAAVAATLNSHAARRSIGERPPRR